MMTITGDDRRVAELREKYPAWDIWYTCAVVSPTAWSGRREGTERAPRIVCDPQSLDEWLAGQP